MILITGAAGKTGLAVLRELARKGAKTRAMVRSDSRREAVLTAGATETVSGSMADRSDLSRAMQGARSVYAICPNMHPDEIEIGRLALEAAREGGLERFVYHSVLHPQTEAMPHHWKKMRVEEAIFESGLEFTILQPCAYMQNLLGYWKAIQQDSVYAPPYAPGTQISQVDLKDAAEAAARVLTEEGHSGATYELCGPEALSPDEMADQIAAALGRAVRAESQPRKAWAERAQASGMGAYELDTLLKMFEYYEKYHFRGNPGVLASLLGRQPRSFADYVHSLSSGDPVNG